MIRVQTRRLLGPLVATGLLVGASGATSSAERQATVTFADANIALIRQTTLYRAAVGTELRDADIVETPDGGAQIEIPPGTIVGVAPHTRVLIRLDRGKPAECDVLIYSIGGIVKLARAAGLGNDNACLQAAQFRAALAAGSAILRFDGGVVSLFAEKGELTMQPSGAAPSGGKSTKVPSDQFAEWRAGQTLKILARPTPEFLAALPGSFEDSLMPMADRVHAGKPEPVAVRQVSYPDVADWLKAMPQNQDFLEQMLPRLRDPEFRRAFDAEHGQHPDSHRSAGPPTTNDSATPAELMPTPSGAVSPR
jgi:hypothetical protein